MASSRFCNVYREHDRTTAWFRENIRDPLREDAEVIFATVAFRWWNRISTGEALLDLLLGNWDAAIARKRLKELPPPHVTGAYVIKTPDGMSKSEGILWCLDKFRHGLHEQELLRYLRSEQPTLQLAHSLLMDAPFLGRFMAYEVVTDLRHTMWLEFAPDVLTWASAGPGCARGLGWLFPEIQPNYNSAQGQKTCLSYMQLILKVARQRWPNWEMREVEHVLCELDKWFRGRNGERLKRRFP